MVSVVVTTLHFLLAFSIFTSDFSIFQLNILVLRLFNSLQLEKAAVFSVKKKL